ncbi:MAG: hypothetical protein ABIT01_14845 [Thermoanaerobaculia bacterium]
MKRFLLSLAILAAIALPVAAKDDTPPMDKKFLGIDKCKKGKFDCEWVSPEFSFSGKKIHVEKFEKVADPPKGDDYGDLHWKNADEFMQNVFIDETNDRLKNGTKFVAGGSGEYTLKGQITEFRYPKKGASGWGWIAEAAGSGAISYDWKIVDKAGNTMVAVHHRILAGASNTLDRRVSNVHNDDMVDFVKKYSK